MNMTRFTVAEMIAALSGLPGNLPVVVNGYEGGLEDAITPQQVAIELNVNASTSTYYGPHEIADDPDKGLPAVFIGTRWD